MRDDFNSICSCLCWVIGSFLGFCCLLYCYCFCCCEEIPWPYQHSSYKEKKLIGSGLEFKFYSIVLMAGNRQTWCWRGRWEFYIQISRHQEKNTTLDISWVSVTPKPIPSDTHLPPQTTATLTRSYLLKAHIVGEHFYLSYHTLSGYLENNMGCLSFAL